MCTCGLAQLLHPHAAKCANSAPLCKDPCPESTQELALHVVSVARAALRPNPLDSEVHSGVAPTPNSPRHVFVVHSQDDACRARNSQKSVP
jgi:hypothetical protein